MCRECPERLIDRKDYCGECAEATKDDFAETLQDVATRAIESLTASELAEIEADFRTHYTAWHARDRVQADQTMLVAASNWSPT